MQNSVPQTEGGGSLVRDPEIERKFLRWSASTAERLAVVTDPEDGSRDQQTGLET
jgi:hypothetical protein